MSGHSHFATIKRQKGLKDAAKSNIFGKLSKMITIAVKSGGGPNPDMNFKLRVAIDKARESNMPKENIDRILKSASEKANNYEEIRYEGFGPFGIAVIVDCATDNKNRTAQELKNLFEKGGGSLGGPNSVAYNFTDKGFLLVEKNNDVETQTLSLIDLGVEDIQEREDGLEVFVAPDHLKEISEKVSNIGFKILKTELTMVPKTYADITDDNQIAKITNFLVSFDDHEDVQRVYSNV
ncbi:MAG: transcriptional regulator [Candidatus Woesebacteria bacterium GW2011_GWA1_33_30]|uniref:Probable transcriptional regulatory protein UR38_C0002G0128 n=1 Tax=Candidatus Woesebacteria bacterium GW2011_GWA2_33_28 TaxID=1618561 RepID=A0A0G0CA11_9BACT|nr:MAG: transcriptional regulator [Candidatus Woesebacteria bacterium GW2011_GWA2_33_28]KKP48838.1 MAG: transcriptional regulator [Candidatus Woesebacteria bacterium GW2011_GWA1_33_30]KKP50111.1 MAG: transcriptional regulator [Microgenomates group bacterium GW2011_GWC1_33_32]KKP51882.1 MAG: transcriptional regulator [Candidatus Woesebacteria bacterium GW2011_GWB1_33_38]KKP56810.1 MAG: transcriptional regulator [Microgenomates group bacterium GW2011_GWD1_33_9]